MSDNQLSGRDLDAEIHVRVMGLPCESKLIGDGKSHETAFRLEPQNAAWRVRSDGDEYWSKFAPDGAERIVIAPRYSESIEAAMQVVERLRADGWSLEINCYSDEYSVSAYMSGKSDDIMERASMNVQTRTEDYRSTSLAKAICLTALEASGVDAAELWDSNEANADLKAVESK